MLAFWLHVALYFIVCLSNCFFTVCFSYLPVSGHSSTCLSRYLSACLSVLMYCIIVVVIAEVELATEQIVWLVIVGLLSWWLSVLMNLKIVIGFSVSNRHKTSGGGGGGAVVARRTVPDNTRHPGIHNYTAENATILWKCLEKMEEHSFSGHWRNSRNCYKFFTCVPFLKLCMVVCTEDKSW